MKNYIKGLIQTSFNEKKFQYDIIENLEQDQIEKIYDFIKQTENQLNKSFTIKELSVNDRNPFITINLSLNLK